MKYDLLRILYAKSKSMEKFNWDTIVAPPMLSILSPYDINLIENICYDPRLISEPKKKKEYIEQILTPRGLIRFAAGTNRVVYKFLENQTILFKIATSHPGIQDSTKEFFNQAYLKPFCAKCHEVSPRGVIGLFERVETINTFEEYTSIAEEHFDLLMCILGSGKYVMEDVGIKFWRNIGIRLGFGPVFVDYPMLYELDGNKLFCNSKNPYTGLPCGGEIDYDAGFNHLFCKKCGLQYMASDVAKKIKENKIVFEKGSSNMKMRIEWKGNVTIVDSNVGSKSYLDDKKSSKNKIKKRKAGEPMKLVSNWEEIRKQRYGNANSDDNTEVISEPVINETEDFTTTSNESVPVLENTVVKDEEEPVVAKAVEVKSSLFGGVETEPEDNASVFDTVNYQQPDNINKGKSDRRKKMENDRKKSKKKNNYSSYDKYSRNSYAPKHSPVPRKGLNNNISFNIEDDDEDTRPKHQYSSKYTHF